MGNPRSLEVLEDLKRRLDALKQQLNDPLHALQANFPAPGLPSDKNWHKNKKKHFEDLNNQLDKEWDALNREKSPDNQDVYACSLFKNKFHTIVNSVEIYWYRVNWAAKNVNAGQEDRDIGIASKNIEHFIGRITIRAKEVKRYGQEARELDGDDRREAKAEILQAAARTFNKQHKLQNPAAEDVYTPLLNANKKTSWWSNCLAWCCCRSLEESQDAQPEVRAASSSSAPRL